MTIAFHAEAFTTADIDRAKERHKPRCSPPPEHIKLSYEGSRRPHQSPTNSCRWTYWGSVDTRNKFIGQSIEVHPTGEHRVDLNEHNDRYVWSKVTTSVHNIIVGKLSIEHHGTMRIRNETTGDSCEITFAQQDWEDAWVEGEGNQVQGSVIDANGEIFCRLRGRCVAILRPPSYI